MGVKAFFTRFQQGVPAHHRHAAYVNITGSDVSLSPSVGGADNVQDALAPGPFIEPTTATPEAIVLWLISTGRMEEAP